MRPFSTNLIKTLIQRRFFAVSFDEYLWIFRAVNGNYVVRVGEHDIRVQNGGQENIPVSRLRLHPSYGSQQRNFIHDIAILRLSKTVTFKRQVSPVCLPLASEEPAPGTRCIVTGWGLMGKVHAVKLQQGNVHIISRTACGTASISSGQVCAGTADGSVDACSVSVVRVLLVWASVMY